MKKDEGLRDMKSMLTRFAEIMGRIGTGNTKSYWRKHRIVKILHSGGPYRKEVKPEQISGNTRLLMMVNHTPFLTRNSRCPCNRGLRFKRCCMLPKQKVNA